MAAQAVEFWELVFTGAGNRRIVKVACFPKPDPSYLVQFAADKAAKESPETSPETLKLLSMTKTGIGWMP